MNTFLFVLQEFEMSFRNSEMFKLPRLEFYVQQILFFKFIHSQFNAF